MKRLYSRLLLLSPLPILVAVVNYTVDPAHVFQAGDYERGVARSLLSGKNVANIANCDTRLVQRFYAAGLAAPKDVLVLGSSRTLEIRGGSFPGRTFYNASVVSAMLEDYLAIYEMHRDRGLTPKVVVLGLDPLTLSRKQPNSAWTTLAPECAQALKRLGQSPPTQLQDRAGAVFQMFKELFSPSYFQTSLRLLRRRLSHTGQRPCTEYGETAASAADVSVTLSDGSLLFGSAVRLRTPAEVREKACEFLRQPPFDRECLTELDEQRQRWLELFVDDLRAHGVTVILLLAPYHPLVYAHVQAEPQYRMVEDAEAYYRALAVQRGIYCIGSYDPSRCGWSEADFHDGVHPTCQALARLLCAAYPLASLPTPQSLH